MLYGLTLGFFLGKKRGEGRNIRPKPSLMPQGSIWEAVGNTDFSSQNLCLENATVLRQQGGDTWRKGVSNFRHYYSALFTFMLSIDAGNLVF